MLYTIVLLAFFSTLSFAQYSLGDSIVRVVDEQGNPVVGAQVHCVNWDNERPRVTPLQPSEQGVTDAEGKALFHNTYQGQSFARIQSDKLGGWFRIDERKDDHNDETVKIGLGRTVKGVVRDEHNEPIADVTILVDGCLPATKTDAEGRYAVPNIGIGNTYSFGYFKEGYAWAKESPRDDMLSVDITMKKGFDVSCVVLGPDGKPVAKASIQTGQYYGETDEGGRFQFSAMPAGERIEVSATRPLNETHYLKGTAAVIIGEKPGEPITITLQETAIPQRPVLRGKIVRADNGKPVTCAMLAGYNEREVTSQPGVSSQSGEFVIDNYSGGVYWISARPLNPALYVSDAPVRVDFSQPPLADIVLKVDEGCCIRGKATTADGKPVGGKWVNLQPMPDMYEPIQTRDNGTFTFANLPGVGIEYTVSMSDDVGQTAQVTVAPLKRGEIREGVELRMPPMVTPHTLRGVARDPQGNPLSNVSVMMVYEDHTRGPSLRWPVTDDAGRFEVAVIASGRVKVSASTSINVNVGNKETDRQQFFTILKNETFDLDATNDSDIEIVMQLKPKTMLGGRITDEAGKGIYAYIKMIRDEREEGAVSDRDGNFFINKTPEPPFLFEVTAPGYKARVQIIDSEMIESSTPFAMMLVQGPFPISESVWAAVTGLPATEDAVQSMPFAAYVRKNEARYYRDAIPPPPPPGAVPPQQSQPPRVRFLDADGKPIQRMMIQPLDSSGAPEVAEYKHMKGYTPRPVASEDGVYSVFNMAPYGTLVWSENTGRVVLQLYEWSPSGPMVIDQVLRPAATLELIVTDKQGKPVAGVPVCLPQLAWEPSDGNLRPYSVGQTDAGGKVSFDQLAPGAHALSIGAGPVKRLVSCRLNDGETKSVTVNLSMNPADPAWLLQTWRDPRDEREAQAKIESAIAEMAANDKQALTLAVRSQLDIMADYRRRGSFREQELRFLAPIAQLLNDQESVPMLQRAIINEPRRLNNGPAPSYSGVGAAARALVTLQGNAALPFFVETASNKELDITSREAAIEAFGRIGTKESAAAFASLRESMRATKGGPAAKAAYTHGERIKEAIAIVSMLLYDDFDLAKQPASNASISISDDYKTANVWASSPYGGTNYKFVRIGDEWLIQEFGGTVVV